MRHLTASCVNEVRFLEACPKIERVMLTTTSQRALFLVHGVINILTDLGLMILLGLIVWDINMRRQKRLVVLGLFWIRIAYVHE